MNEGVKEVITPKKNLLDINLKEIWSYRDLLVLFVRRDFVAVYKQTILGPMWFVIQPIFTTLIFTLIFGKLASIPTDGLPQIKHPILLLQMLIFSEKYISQG